ncbi:hypothetical protein R50072_12170 [Simiduia litorea]
MYKDLAPRDNLEFSLRDSYTADAYVLAIMSAEKSTGITLRQFLDCALQDKHDRLAKKLNKFNARDSTFKLPNNNEEYRAIHLMVESKLNIEYYWDKYNKFDCDSIEW